MHYLFYRCEDCFYSIKAEVEVLGVDCPFCLGKLVKFTSPLSVRQNYLDYYEQGGKKYFSMALARVVESEDEEERIMKEKGYIREDKLEEQKGEIGFVDRFQADVTAKQVEIERRSKMYTDAIDRGESKGEAFAIAFPMEDCLNGTLDLLFDEIK